MIWGIQEDQIVNGVIAGVIVVPILSGLALLGRQIRSVHADIKQLRVLPAQFDEHIAEDKASFAELRAAKLDTNHKLELTNSKLETLVAMIDSIKIQIEGKFGHRHPASGD